jgi:hypothetical protein
LSENRESKCRRSAPRILKSVGKSSGAEPDIGGLGARGSPPGTLGEEEASAVMEVEAAASRSSIEALLLVYLPRVSLSWFEVSSDIDMAAKGNRKQNRSEIDSRERLKYPSLAVGSTMKARSYLRVPKSSGIYKTELRYEDPSPGRVTREAREVELTAQEGDA